MIPWIASPTSIDNMQKITVLPHPTTDLSSSPSAYPSRAQRLLAQMAILTTLPYACLKVAWLSGSRIGLNDPSFGSSTTMHLLNGLTLGLDIVACALAMVFATARGLRAPTWLVAPPMWVGYGLLGQILLTLPMSLLVSAFASPAREGSEVPPIAGWVYACVYSGFAGLGLCLLPAFAMYAMRRWGIVGQWRARLGSMPAAGVPRLLLAAVGVVALACILRAIGTRSALEALTPLVDLLMMAIAAGALWALGSARPARMPRWLPLLGLWGSSGALASWGVYSLVLDTLPNDLVTEAASPVDIGVNVANILIGGLLATRIAGLSRSHRRA